MTQISVGIEEMHKKGIKLKPLSSSNIAILDHKNDE